MSMPINQVMLHSSRTHRERERESSDCIVCCCVTDRFVYLKGKHCGKVTVPPTQCQLSFPARESKNKQNERSILLPNGKFSRKEPCFPRIFTFDRVKSVGRRRRRKQDDEYSCFICHFIYLI